MAVPRDFEIPPDAPRQWNPERDGDAILVTGRDRVDFLRRILSGTVPPVGGVSRTALLTPKGALIAAGTASTTRDAIVLETEWRRRDALLTGLDRYRIADDVELSPLDGDAGGSVLLQGFGSETIIEGILADLRWPVPANLDLSRLTPGTGADLPRDRGGAFLIRRLFRPWPTWRLRFLEIPYGLDLAAASLTRQSVERAGSDERGYLRVAAGEPAWESELNATSRVAESGLAAHARLGQGCYIGQEFVARQAHRGRIPRLLRRLASRAGAGAPPASTPLELDGRVVGRFGSAFDPPSGWEFRSRLPALGLAILRAQVPVGAIVTADLDTGRYRGRVLPD